MTFSTPTFLFLFLPLVLLIYYISSPKLRNLVLFMGSLVFYAWGEPVYIWIMLFSTFFDYFNGKMIERWKEKGESLKAKGILFLSMIVNLGMLGFFKYSNFMIDSINAITSLGISHLDFSLPIGISFYTFQTMSYTIDVYLGKVKAQTNIIHFGTYVTLFPQLVAGPIVRYNELEEQLGQRKESFDKFSYGVKRLSLGLFKKVIIANNMGVIWTQISALGATDLSILSSWLGIIAFGFQIYFDFAGYSDMAIGLASMFGFTLRENFDFPYTSKSITEFWRRWHISLGTWFKEYVYIPLGGNRGRKSTGIRNIFIVWFLTGLWHGASWNFILWGLYFGVLLFLEKVLLKKYLEKLPRIAQHIYSVFFIEVGWLLFAFEDFKKILMYGKIMFGFGGNAILDDRFMYSLTSNAFLLILAIISSSRFFIWAKETWEAKYDVSVLEGILVFCGFFLSICFLVGSSYNPFLYFRF